MLERFQRFAVYYAPNPRSDLAQAGAAWLGWDAKTGAALPHPDLGLDLASMTATPRKYGLHATIKPPMRLGGSVASFLDGVEALADSLAPVDLGMLRLKSLDGFLAIVPTPQPQALSDCAAEIVRALDPFRAPATESELARRRAGGLSARQEDLLALWGFPYVMDEFRFHITLTGRLPDAQMQDALRAAHGWFGPALAKPHAIDALCVFGEDEAGRFHLLRRIPLRG
jgi:putative phosphonate metabolism protein